MPLILLVEQDEGVVSRLRQTLSAEGGWRLQHARSAEEAMQRVASEAPDLFVVSTRISGASNILGAFARRQGGPGTLALVPAGTAPEDFATVGLGADAALAPPVSGERVREAVERILHGGAKPAPAPPPPGRDEPKLTSHDIFGDLVAEVEREARANRPQPAKPAAPRTPTSGPPPVQPGPPSRPSPPPSSPPGQARQPAQPPRSGQMAQPSQSTQPGPPARPATPAARSPRRTRVDDDIERRLEQTLSGVLPGSQPSQKERAVRPDPPSDRTGARPPKRRQTSSDVDALISKTLSGLETPKTKRPAPPAGRAAKPAEPPAFGLSDLEELARASSRRRAARPPAENPSSAARPATPQASEKPPPAADPPAATESAPEAATPPVERPAFTPQFAETIEEVPEGADGVIPPAAAEAGGAESAPSTGTQGTTFGQYRLQERIGVGGMAEVWKARMTGVEGFQKTVAIKKILPHLTDSSDFVEMFVDEAKLAAQLNHAHIIHIYDLGRIEGDYYIAMEYVEGENLRAILNAARERGRPLPVGLALYVAARLASALDYAHRKRDFEDRNLELVHRDVSPQNVLIGYEGTIKLCDFGIVKAVSKSSHTRMGALKGKLQYMSPEQAWGRNVDGRSDIFSLGALLFEMLTGRRLFSGDSEMEVLEAVRECRVQAPGSLDPSVPEEVDAIVLKALARDPDERFQNASELERRLEEELVAMRPPPGQAELATYMRELFEREPTAVSELESAPEAAGEKDESVGELLLESAAGFEMSDVAAGAPAADASAPAATEHPPADPRAQEPPAEPPWEEVGAQQVDAAAPTARATDAPTGTGAGTGSGDWAGTGTGISPPRTAPGDATGTATHSGALRAVEPVSEVEPEEGGGKGKGLLVAAIIAALIVAALLYWFVWLPRRAGGGGAAEQPPAVQEPQVPGTAGGTAPPAGPSDAPAEGATGLDATGQDAANGAPLPAAGGDGAAGDQATSANQAAAAGAENAAVQGEVEERLEEALARREKELRKEFEAKQRELAARVEAAKARAAEPIPQPSEKPAAGSGTSSKPGPRPGSKEGAAPGEPPPSRPAGAGGAAEPTEPPTAGAGAGNGSAEAASEPQTTGAPQAATASGKSTGAPANGTSPEPVSASNAITRRAEPALRPAAPGAAKQSGDSTVQKTVTAPPKPSVRVGQLVQMGPGVVPPQLVSFEKPEYPPIARRLRVQGEVVVAVLVDENGDVADARLERSIPQKVGINEAALDAARRAKYRPATKDSVRVKMWTTLKIPFRL